jgi:hypothetical protein
MEPERKMEKLLRAYAKKRRAQAGGPLKLHPATRRMLLAESARATPKADAEESVSRWELFRRQWAMLVGFALIIFFVLALFLPGFSSSKKKTQIVTALNNPKQFDLAAPMAAGPTNGTLPTELAFAKAKDLARREIAEAPVTSEKNVVPFGASRASAFALAEQNMFKNTVAPGKTAVVLANFEVQQNGNAIRVVDADGSVYDGALQPESVIAQNEPAAAAAPPVLAPGLAELQKNIARRYEPESAQNYFFRVTGTNQTLKQNVVFTGNLLANGAPNKLPQPFQSGGGGFGGGQLRAALTNQLPWSNSRIAGTAVVAATNDVEIDAVPLAP